MGEISLVIIIALGAGAYFLWLRGNRFKQGELIQKRRAEYAERSAAHHKEQAELLADHNAHKDERIEEKVKDAVDTDFIHLFDGPT